MIDNIWKCSKEHGSIRLDLPNTRESLLENAYYVYKKAILGSRNWNFLRHPVRSETVAAPTKNGRNGLFPDRSPKVYLFALPAPSARFVTEGNPAGSRRTKYLISV